MELISRFRGEYKFLSNFYEASFEYEGRTYPSSEHAYQERKTDNPEQRKYIREGKTAFESAKRGRQKDIELRKDWLKIKGSVMKPIVEAKFRQNPDIAEKLIGTGDAYIMEGNYWHDNYFGNCCCKRCHDGPSGKNVLGLILMDLRYELMMEKANLKKCYFCDEFIEEGHEAKEHTKVVLHQECLDTLWETGTSKEKKEMTFWGDT